MWVQSHTEVWHTHTHTHTHTCTHMQTNTLIRIHTHTYKIWCIHWYECIHPPSTFTHSHFRKLTSSALISSALYTHANTHTKLPNWFVCCPTYWFLCYAERKFERKCWERDESVRFHAPGAVGASVLRECAKWSTHTHTHTHIHLNTLR